MMLRAVLVALAVCLFAVSAEAQTAVIHTQGGNTQNSSTVSGAATAIVKTVTVSSHVRGHVYSVSAFCSAGTAGLTITDGATTIWQSPSGWIGTTLISASWIPGLTGTLGQNMVITMTSCGGSNTGTLNLQADIF